MREIIFRGKCPYHGDWIYGQFLPKSGTICTEKVHDNSTLYVDLFVDVETVGQYIGLTDKNGTKIFEGDICCDEESHFTVVWSESECGFKFKWEDEYFDVDQVYGEIEIIGNIYDGVSED